MIFHLSAYFPASRPIDVATKAHALGIATWESDQKQLPAGSPGLIRRDPNHGGHAGYSIIVRSSDNYFKRRFTICDLLGHFTHHRNLIGPNLTLGPNFRTRLGTIYDLNASRIAVDILLPMWLIHACAQKLKTLDPKTLADELQVTEAAMRIRLRVTFIEKMLY